MAAPIGRKKLGTQGLEVSALGLGCMGFAGMYKENDILPDENALNVIHGAFNKGVTFFDTSDAYGPHTSEIFLGKALKGLPREKVQLATKFGICNGLASDQVRGDPEYVRQCCEASLKRLHVDYIDLYYQHRIDPDTPIEATMGEMKKLKEEGKIKYIGLSEASVDTIRRAHAVLPITAVQLEYSLWEREVEDDIIPVCRELGIGIVPYSPLGRGFFSGKASSDTHETDSRNSRYPRFERENLEKNKVLYQRVATLGEKHGCTAGQLALAWVSCQGDDVAPIPGTTKAANLEQNLGSLNVKLGSKELDEVAAAVPRSEVAGERYNEGLSKFTWKSVTTPPMSSWTGKA